MSNQKAGLMQLINFKTFIPPAVLLTLGVIFGAAFPQEFGAASNKVLGFITEQLGWMFTLGSIILLLFCFWAGFSKYGRIKLGGPEAKPQMSLFSWFAVSFTSSLAIGISYWCVAEPMTHFMNPPGFLGIEGGTAEAAQMALRYTYLHWAFVPFAIYASAGVAVAFLFFNAGKPFRVSSALYPLVGEKANGGIGNLVDAIAIFAMVGGIGTSLGLGTMQIAGGLEYAFGLKSGISTLAAIILIMTVLYTTVACSGLLKGIKWVGNLNMGMYFFLLLFIFILGPTRAIIENIITSAGDYIQNFIPITTNVDPILQSGFHEGWTTFYWAWWLAFAPLTGLFMIKLAKGRTVRQFVLMNLFAPASFVLIWFGTFGTAGIFSDMFQGTNIGQIISEEGSAIALFALLKNYPLFSFMSVFALILVGISFNTQAEAVCLTLSTMTTVGYDASGNEKAPPKPMIIFWGVLMGLITIILLYTGGEQAFKALQTSVVVCGLPIIFLQVIMAGAYVKCMKNCKQYDKVGTFDHPAYKDIVADQN